MRRAKANYELFGWSCDADADADDDGEGDGNGIVPKIKCSAS